MGQQMSAAIAIVGLAAITVGSLFAQDFGGREKLRAPFSGIPPGSDQGHGWRVRRGRVLAGISANGRNFYLSSALYLMKDAGR